MIGKICYIEKLEKKVSSYLTYFIILFIFKMYLNIYRNKIRRIV